MTKETSISEFDMCEPPHEYDQYKDRIDWDKFNEFMKDDKFKYYLEETILYALINHMKNRGPAASGALMFDKMFGDKIMKPREEKESD